MFGLKEEEVTLPFHIREPAIVGTACIVLAVLLVLIRIFFFRIAVVTLRLLMRPIAFFIERFTKGGSLTLQLNYTEDDLPGMKKRALAMWSVFVAIPLTWGTFCLMVATDFISNGPAPVDPLLQSPLYEEAKKMSEAELKEALTETAKGWETEQKH